MALAPSAASGPVSNRGKIYSVFAAGFVLFVVVLGILETVGVPEPILGVLFAGFTLALYAGIGILARTMQVSEFFAAGRRIPAAYNGMAGAADGMSGVAFISMAGLLYALGHDGLAFIIGWSGGYVLLAIMIAPYLRKFGAYTLPEFLSARYEGAVVRLLAVGVLLAASFVFAVAQFRGAGLIAERFLGLPYHWGLAVAGVTIACCSALGGMRALTWTQVAQFIVMAIAFLVPVVVMSMERSGLPFPQLTYGDALASIDRIERQMVATGLAGDGIFEGPARSLFDVSALNFLALTLCLIIGTASLPHVVMRSFTTSSVRRTRRSFGWTLLFVTVLFITAPAYAAFVKLEIYQSVIGQPFANLPDWIYVWGATDQISICGAAARSLEAVAAACLAAGTDLVRYADFEIARDAVILAAPEIAGLPFVIAGLVGAGALAALLSTATALVVAMGNSLAHDIYHAMLDPQAPRDRRLAAGRLCLIAVTIAAGMAAGTARLPDMLTLVAWAFSIAAAGNFPVLVLGIWWSRCTPQGAIAGMCVGLVSTLGYLIYTAPAPFGLAGAPILGLSNLASGLVGVVLGFAVAIGVSLLTPAPSARADALLREIRRPRGPTMLHRGDARPAE